MKEILAKLAKLESAGPKAKTAPNGKRLLNERTTVSPTHAQPKVSRFRAMFEAMSIGQKPIPVVGKEGDRQQTGAGMISITDNSPAAVAVQKAIGDLAASGKAQIIMPQQNGQQNGQAPQQNSQQNNRMSGAGAPNPNMVAGQQQIKEAPGKTSNYEAGHRIYEISEEIKDLVEEAYQLTKGTNEEGRAHSYWYPHIAMAINHDHGYMGRNMFTMAQSADALMGGDGEGYEERDRDAEDEEEDLREADIPSDQTDMGAGLGAGRKQTTLEHRKKRR